MVGRLLLIVTLLIAIGIITGCYSLFFDFPPTQWIVGNYFDAILRGDAASALDWLTDAGHCGIMENEAKRVQEDIQQFANAEVRNLGMQVQGGGGSDRRIQVGEVHFEYRRHEDEAWRPGVIGLMTTTGYYPFRFGCGRIPWR